MSERTTMERPIRRRVSKRTVRRRLGVLIALIAVVVYVAAQLLNLGQSNFTVLHLPHGQTVDVPKDPTLSPLRRRIVSIAESQIGYTTNPPTTYCNKYSAFWFSGSDDCSNANLDEQWCADFAAWVWRKAGASVVYQYLSGDINASSASFYEWGLARGTWHPVGSHYVARPGDVALYGLNEADLVAAHVAIVIGMSPGSKGPIGVNGDGDLTGFSLVEVRTDEYEADVHPNGAELSGYVSPTSQ